MAQNLVTVCVFCLLCATHVPCSAHTELQDGQNSLEHYRSGLSDPNRINIPNPPQDTLLPFKEHRTDFGDNLGNNKISIRPENKPVENDAGHIEKLIENNKLLAQLVIGIGNTGSPTVKQIVQDYHNNIYTFLNKLENEDTESNGNPNHETPTVNALRQLHRHKRVKKSVRNQINSKSKREFTVGLDEQYIKKLFVLLEQTEDKISIAAFKCLVTKLGLELFFANSTSVHYPYYENKTCLTGETILSNIANAYRQEDQIKPDNATNSSNVFISALSFRQVCPLLIYQLAADTSYERQGCVINPTINVAKQSMNNHNESPTKQAEESTVWLYATLSVITISACGLLGVAVIPFMQKHFYHQLLQFLVALAVGTLCGDALLHLLPHAMMSHSHHHDAATSREDSHALNMWKGFVAMLGIIFFYFIEKFLTLGAEWRKRRQKKHKLPSRVRVMRDNDSIGNNSVGEKLCKHKYSSYPYCYDEIATETQDDHHNRTNNHIKKTTCNASLDSSHNNTNVTALNEFDSDVEDLTFPKSISCHSHKPETNQNDVTEASKNIEEPDKLTSNNKTVSDLPRTDLQLSEEESYTVILREHESKHHGHSHTHGHVHSAPKSLSSVAWMVVMGDGLHNFTDGMAIGAAFASGLAGGFSTSVAVFCHELPHEIGDFAVLLKAGMTAKQAVFYNMLSSVLCFFGCIIGVVLGHSDAASEWIFAAAAGMFIYIALVDMIPELTSSHSKEGGSLLQCLLQFIGLMSGLGIMSVIALYENDLKIMFHGDE